MDEPSSRHDAGQMPVESGDDQIAKKRPKLTFINPAEWADLEAKRGSALVNEPGKKLYQRFVDRQAKSIQEDFSGTPGTSEVEDQKTRKRQRRQKSAKNRSKKRPLDPKRPWLDSDGEEVDCALPLDDDSDDDDFLRRLQEEKEREEAEERKQKAELKRQRQLLREEKRARATGRVGRPKAQPQFTHIYANSTDDPQSSSKPSETSDEEQSVVNDYEDEDQTLNADSFDLPPPPSVDNESLSELDQTITTDTRWMDIVTLRRSAPPLTLPPSSSDLLCPPEQLLDTVSIYETLRCYGRLLRLSPFQLEDFLSALSVNENSTILAETHMSLLKALMTEDDVNGTHLCPPDCKDVYSLIAGFLIDRYTWPSVLAQYLDSVKCGEAAAITALARVGIQPSVGSVGPIAAATVSGGADTVVTAAVFFPDNILPLDPSYPFVEFHQRVAVLRGLVSLFVATGPVRGDILREGFTAHDDFCRVCRQSGEVLCCDGCPAVFHLNCLTPPLEAVPNTSWHCPLCIAEQEAYGRAKLPRPSGQTRIPPLGYDRAGRIYWHAEGRLFVEPVDFAQREPALPGLLPGTRDDDWERAEADSPSGDPRQPGDATLKEADEGGEEAGACDPSIAYAYEPPLYYYTSLADIRALRTHLSSHWEPSLCCHLDALITSLEGEAEIISPEEEKDGEIVASGGEKWPLLPALPPALSTQQLTSLFSNSDRDEKTRSRTTKGPSMEKAFVLELSGGVLVHNQDGLFENIPSSPENYNALLMETHPPLVFTPLSSWLPCNARRAPDLRWRSWTNTLGRGLFLPNPLDSPPAPPLISSENLINISLNRLQQHDERDKRRLLGNKFSLTEVALDAWKWLDGEAAARVLRRAIKSRGEEEGEGGWIKRHRAEAVGPLRWLHTIKLTLCYLEAQLPAGILCPVWRLVRKDWLAAVLGAKSIGDLADLLSRLEAVIRPVAFQRTWNSSIGPLQFDRFTWAQREEEKRLRALERSAVGGPNGTSSTLVRTKTPTVIRHTVWKTRGEEYRRLGGDGWQWISVTRRSSHGCPPPRHSKQATDNRPPQLGIGWGVLPQMLSQTEMHPPVPEEPTVEYGRHPITGIPLCRNVNRHMYKIPVDQIISHLRQPVERKVEEKNEGDDSKCVDGEEGEEPVVKMEENEHDIAVVDISKCLRNDGAPFYPPAAWPIPHHSTITTPHQHHRSTFRLDALLALRRIAASRDLVASQEAGKDLDRLRREKSDLAAEVAEARGRLSRLARDAATARSEHVKAVKARQSAIADMRRVSQPPATPYVSRPFTQAYGQQPQRTTPRRVGGVRVRSSGRRPSRKLVWEEYNYDSGESEESVASPERSSSPSGSNTTGSQVLRRSSRRQKVKSADPDFVTDIDDLVGGDEDDGAIGGAVSDGDVDPLDDVVKAMRRDSDSEGVSGDDAEYRIPRAAAATATTTRAAALQQQQQQPPSALPGHPFYGRMPQFDGVDDSPDENEQDWAEKDQSDGSNVIFVSKPMPASHLLLQRPPTSSAPSSLPSTAPAAPTQATCTLRTCNIPPITATTAAANTSPRRSILAQAIEGQAGGVARMTAVNGNSGDATTTTTTTSSISAGGRGVTGPISTTTGGASGQPLRLVRVLRTPAGSQAQEIDTTAASASTPTATANLIIPASTDSVLQKSLIQLSSKGGVIMTQASSLPAGYRIITPSSLAPATGRTSLNFVQVVSTTPTTTTTMSATPLRPRMIPITPQQIAPRTQVAIAPAPGSTLRPLLAGPVVLGGSVRGFPQPISMRPRMVRMAPMKLDAGLDVAVSTTASKLHEIELEAFNLRKELKILEKKLAELTHLVDEKEAIVTRLTVGHTSRPYSLSSSCRGDDSAASGHLLEGLNRALKTLAATQKQPMGRQFIPLPRHHPPISPYAWPPDHLFLSKDTLTASHRSDAGQTTTVAAGASSLFRLSRENLRSVILAAGRKEMPGYEAEKKRLSSIPWSYPTARPCLAETWRFRLRQIIHAAYSSSSSSQLNPPVAGSHRHHPDMSLTTPSHAGVAMASFALLLRMLWHSLRWDEIVLSAATCDDVARDLHDRVCFKQMLAESHGGGFTLRRVVAIQPLDKYWLRANFLLQTSVHKPSRVKRFTRSAASGRSTNQHGDRRSSGMMVTPRSTRGRGGGAGRPKRADPDYDPDVDEGWRVGIPSSANRRSGRNTTVKRYHSDEEDDAREEEEQEDADDDEDEQEMAGATVKEEWISEEAAHGINLWEIRHFFDTLLPIDSDYYPPPMPKLALLGLPASLVSEATTACPVTSSPSRGLKREPDDDDDDDEKPAMSSISSSRPSWIQPARCPSPEPPRAASPKPPEPPKPLPPPPSIPMATPQHPLMTTTTMSASPQPLLISPASMRPQITNIAASIAGGRPLIVNSSTAIRPAVVPHPPALPTGTVPYNTPLRFAPAAYPPSRQRAPPAPLSPNSEAARARARSIAASNAARISAANRRLRSERVALETRVANLAEELENRRSLAVKYLALQIQEDILDARKAEKDAATAAASAAVAASASSRTHTPIDSDGGQLSPMPSPKLHHHHHTGTPAAPSALPRGRSSLQTPTTDGPPRKRGRPPGSTRGSAIARQQPLRRTPSTPSPTSLPLRPGTPDTLPAMDSDEERCAIRQGETPPRATQFELEQLVRKERMMKNTTGAVLALTHRGSRRPGRPRGSIVRQTHDTSSSSSTAAAATKPFAPSQTPRGSRGRGRGRGRGAMGATKPRFPIRTPSYLLKDMGDLEAKDETPEPSSSSDFGENDEDDDDDDEGGDNDERAAFGDVEEEVAGGSDGCRLKEKEGDGKLYCLCKTPYDPKREYIGCDLCQDWFHFVCVGLKPGLATTEELGDSWHCPDCQKANNKASEEVYCLCQTPYDDSRVYIACDRCDEWYHAECVGLTLEVAAAHTGAYVCPVCEKKSADDNKGSGSTKSKSNDAQSENQMKTIHEAPLTEKMKRQVGKLIKELQAHKLSWPFMKPPPVLALKKLATPLKEPTQLPFMADALNRGVYKSLGDVSFAGSQLFSNARRVYAPDSAEINCTDVLEATFLRRMKEIRSEAATAAAAAAP